MHHVVREPCHTGYLNTVQHTDNPRFLSSPYHKHQYLEQIQLVHSLVKRHHEQLAQHQLRFVVVSNENPYDVRYLVPPSSSNARSGGNTRAVRGGGDNTDYMKQVAVLSSYDATGISLAYLGLGMWILLCCTCCVESLTDSWFVCLCLNAMTSTTATTIRVSMLAALTTTDHFTPTGTLDVGLNDPLNMVQTLKHIPNRPCPAWEEEDGHIGNDPANHKTRWNEEDRKKKETKKLRDTEEERKRLTRSGRL